MQDVLIPVICSVIVGLVFLITGIAKTIEPWKFIDRISQLKIVPAKWNLQTALSFTAIECAFGVALILAVEPTITIPMSILFILGLSALTYWSTSTGRTEDCGCYNDMIEISPTTSLILNGVYIVLLIAALILNPWHSTVLWQWMLVLKTLLTTYALAYGSLIYRSTKGRPCIDLTPIQPKHPWQQSWLDEEINSALNLDSAIIVFLGPKCPACKNWLNVLKVIHNREDLPDVLGIISLASTSVEEGEEFVNSYDLNFPVGGLEAKKYQKLGIAGVPTAVLLQNGIIQDKWVGNMPKEFIERIRAGDLSYRVSA